MLALLFLLLLLLPFAASFNIQPLLLPSLLLHDLSQPAVRDETVFDSDY